jgi:hypothetical protein
VEASLDGSAMGVDAYLTNLTTRWHGLDVAHVTAVPASMI